MQITVNIKDKDETLKAIERAEELLEELKKIFSWELGGKIELEIEGSTVSTDDPKKTI